MPYVAPTSLITCNLLLSLSERHSFADPDASIACGALDRGVEWSGDASLGMLRDVFSLVIATVALVCIEVPGRPRLN